MKDVSHHHHVSLRQIVLEEVAGLELQPVCDANSRHVFLEDRRHFREVETRAGEMRIREGDLRRQIALGRADVDERAVVLPRKRVRDRQVRAVADPRHRRQEFPQPRRLGIQRLEQPRRARLHLVLRQPRPQRLGQAAPERVKAVIAHLEDAADIRRLAAVEEQIGFRSIRVDVAGPRQKPEGDERVEEVARRSRMQAKPASQRIVRFGASRQFGEHAHFNGAQQRFRRPERKTGLQNLLGCQLVGH